MKTVPKQVKNSGRECNHWAGKEIDSQVAEFAYATVLFKVMKTKADCEDLLTSMMLRW